jgi:uncharacterized membrane protein YoaK (UPF0700 family)
MVRITNRLETGGQRRAVAGNDARNRGNEAVVADPQSASSSVQSQGPVGGFSRCFVDERDGPLPALLLGLTVLAGVVDATTILRLGHVFVATVTGNLVFLGLAAAGARGFAVGICALAVGGFLVGVPIGGRACVVARSHRGLALRNVLGVKLLLASAVTLIAILTGPRFPVGARDTMVVLMAMSMGAQLAVIRYLKVPDLLTVVLTMTIIGAITEHGGGWSDPKVLRRGIALLAFAVGALSGALLVLNVGVAASLAFGLAIIVTVAIAAYLVSRTSPSWTRPTST